MKILPFVLSWCFLFTAGHLRIRAGPSDTTPEQAGIKIPSTKEIERSLLALANRSRMEGGLEPLRLLPALTETATRHSRDMARQGKTFHISADGRTLTDRLVESGLFFAALGENVAFSETFVVEFIHDAFMASPEHRENLLDPQFDRAGCGVIQVEGKGYYITQNFLMALNPGDIPEPFIHNPLSFWSRVGFQVGLQERLMGLRSALTRQVNEIRGSRSLPPLQMVDQANTFAGRLAAPRLGGRELPSAPDSFGISHLIFLSAPSLELLGKELEEIPHEDYIRGGLDIRFGRGADLPGGGLFVTLVLFPEPEAVGKEPAAHREQLERKIQAMRSSRGLLPLRMEKSLSEAALEISRRIMKNNQSDRRPTRMASFHVISYVTQDLLSIPEILRRRLLQKTVRRIGIGISSAGGKELSVGNFWVTIIYR